MTEEEKKVIERLSLKAITSSAEAPEYPNTIVMKKDLITALNLISKLQADIEIKDKVIDDLCFAITHEEIPQEFYCHSTSINCEMVGGTMECKECLKQAVYEEVEKVGGENE